MVDYNLYNRLKSLRNYFFMGISDYLVHFFDSAEEELVKKSSKFSKEKISSLLELATEQSSLKNDPYREKVICDLTAFTLLE